MIKPVNIINYYKDKLTDKESKRYLNIHAKRYAFILNQISKIRDTIKDKKINILDIGPSFLTELMQNQFQNDNIYSLGYSHPESRGGQLPKGVSINHKLFIPFDLNDSQDKSKWIKVPSCNIVVLAEVIEHVYTSPALILEFIKSFLDDKGKLIIQTPNAMTLYNRLTVLRGRNFIEMIRENNQNPGHFREYTKDELYSLAENSNYKVVDFIYSNYFSDVNLTLKLKIYRRIQNLLKDSFKDGMTIVLKKDQ